MLNWYTVGLLWFLISIPMVRQNSAPKEKRSSFSEQRSKPKKSDRDVQTVKRPKKTGSSEIDNFVNAAFDLNDKIIDWKIDYKKKELTNYAKFHLECWNEYKRDNGYYSKDFIEKYLKWQKQDVSNLNKYHHKVFNYLENFSKDYQFTTEMWELQKKMMQTVPIN